ncbi:hypothetical protein [Lentzea sp. NPDC060358]|uniref:hypothetical protein n=1 Tax=Lentzea sp. NPDC060358 TaxID=3347103 RepID=UPI00364CFE1C
MTDPDGATGPQSVPQPDGQARQTTYAGDREEQSRELLEQVETYRPPMSSAGTYYLGYSHEQLKAMVTDHMDPATADAQGAAFNRIGSTLATLQRDLQNATTVAGDSWDGVAAGNALGYFTDVAVWSGNTAQAAQLTGNQLSQQGAAASLAKNSMPEPVQYSTADALSDFFSAPPWALVDTIDKIQERFDQKQKAHEEAAEVLTAMSSSFQQLGATTPAFAPPPTMADSSGSTSTSAPASAGTAPASAGPAPMSTGLAPTSAGPPPTSVSPPPTWPSAPAGSTPTGGSTPPSGVGQGGDHGSTNLTQAGSGGSYPPGGRPGPSGQSGLNIPHGLGSTGIPVGPIGSAHPGLAAPTGPGLPGRQGPGGGRPGGGAGGGGATGGGGRAGGVPGVPGAFGGATAAKAGFVPGGSAGVMGTQQGGFGPSGSGAAGRGGPSGAGGPVGGAGGGAGRGQGEEDLEHRAPSYLVEADDVFGDSTMVAPPVIGG